MVYITKEDALGMGFTHEGYLFGVPAWFDGAGDDAGITPKFIPFQYWCWLADKACEFATLFMREDQGFHTPIRITGRIR